MFRKLVVALIASILVMGALVMPGAAQDATPAASPVVTPTTEAPSNDHHHHSKPDKTTAAALPNTGSGDTTDPSIAIGFAVIAAGVLAGAAIFVRQRRRDITL